MEAEKILEKAAEALKDRKGENIVALDLRGLSSVTDFFLIASGRSNIHVQALCDAVEEKVHSSLGKAPLRVEGKGGGRWILMDYGDVVVHVFYRDAREYYDLEGLWMDAKRIDLGLEVGYEEED